jgi:hypothetical protein
MVAGHHYYTATGPLATTRTHEPVMSESVADLVASARG